MPATLSYFGLLEADEAPDERAERCWTGRKGGPEVTQ
jgi:hypothetical protein